MERQFDCSTFCIIAEVIITIQLSEFDFLLIRSQYNINTFEGIIREKHLKHNTIIFLNKFNVKFWNYLKGLWKLLLISPT